MDLEIDEPFWTVRTPKLAVRFTVGADEDPETLEDGDVLVIAPNGDRWWGVILTMGRIQAIMDRERGTGDSLGGAYFWAKGLVIVREPGMESMVRAIEDLYDSYGHLDGVLPRTEPDDEDDDEDDDL
ncbi:hypothetical protein [Streptomyces sp. NPDC096132]|uniref:hypothetical protein n=1 Tax=Streptomyces sp. NPDC096132 TaxID=3366075 RepID=UPI0037FFC6C4